MSALEFLLHMQPTMMSKGGQLCRKRLHPEGGLSEKASSFTEIGEGIYGQR